MKHLLRSFSKQLNTGKTNGETAKCPLDASETEPRSGREMPNVGLNGQRIPWLPSLTSCQPPETTSRHMKHLLRSFPRSTKQAKSTEKAENGRVLKEKGLNRSVGVKIIIFDS
jgi:hypothetical protein